MKNESTHPEFVKPLPNIAAGHSSEVQEKRSRRRERKQTLQAVRPTEPAIGTIGLHFDEIESVNVPSQDRTYPLLDFPPDCHCLSMSSGQLPAANTRALSHARRSGTNWSEVQLARGPAAASGMILGDSLSPHSTLPGDLVLLKFVPLDRSRSGESSGETCTHTLLPVQFLRGRFARCPCFLFQFETVD